MRYLISGGCGFVGSHVVDALIERGDDVVVLDDLSTGKYDNLHSSATFEHGSVADQATCQRICEGIDRVVHLAAIASAPMSVDYPWVTFEVNCVGTHNLLLAARDAGVKRFVFASSASYYGYQSGVKGQLITEKQPAAPVSPYAASKVMGETMARMYRHVYDLSTVSLRYFNMYGPRRLGDTGYAAVIPQFITAALRGDPLIVHGDGEQRRDFVFIGDAVRATLALCDGGVLRAYNVCTGMAITINELAKAVIDIVGNDVEIQHVEPRPGDVRGDAGNFGMLAIATGGFKWTDLHEGLKETVEWHRGLMS